jgi:hypothetical protein
VRERLGHARERDLAGRSRTGGAKKRESRGALSRAHAKRTLVVNSTIAEPDHDPISSEGSELKRIKELPKEVGVMLVTAGIVGLVLPGPGTPAIIAGGLALWPAAFEKLEAWLERRHPRVHRESMKQIGRFLDDLERRYPYADRK